MVAALTGSQLKDPDYVLRCRSEAGADRRQLRVEPTREALRAALGGSSGRRGKSEVGTSGGKDGEQGWVLNCPESPQRNETHERA